MDLTINNGGLTFGSTAAMESVKIVIEPNAYAPMLAHVGDAAIDLRAMSSGVVKPHGYAFFDTGVRFGIPSGWCGVIMSRSGMNAHSGITATGLIDPGYKGTVGVILHNDGDEEYEVNAGDRIAQMMFVRYGMPQLVLVSNNDSERGEDGFGSTGR